MRPLRQGPLRITGNRGGASENSLMVAVPWMGLPEPDGLMPDTADPPAPIRTFDDLLIAHQRLIGGALREVATAPFEKTLLSLSRRHDRVHVPVPGGR